MAEHFEAIDSAEEIQQLREFLASLPISEQRRLAEWFLVALEPKVKHQEQDWSDTSDDGSRKAPSAMSASNGQS